MNIDVDIKITEEDKQDGTCLVKHFSDRLDQYNGIPLVKSEDTRKFEEFLSEVLTGSGQIVRSNLLKKNQSDLVQNQLENKNSGIEELQYTFTLKTGQSLSGRIPLGDLNLFSVPEVISGITGEKNSGKRNGHKSFLFNHDYAYANKRLERMKSHGVGEVIGAVMQKAIRKYEDNIFFGTGYST